MKTVILNPPQYVPLTKDKTAYGIRVDDTLGVGYLASYAIVKNHDVEVADMYTWPWERAENFIRSRRFDIAAVACSHSVDRFSAFRTARLIKEINPKVKIVFGGHHASAMASQIVRSLPVDAVVVGEGEETFEELIYAWETGGDLRKVSGLVFTDGGDSVATPPRKPIENLDAVPFPLRQPTPQNRTIAAAYPYQLAVLKHNGKVIGSRTYASIATSRGCPYKCRFCSVAPFWGSGWRMRSARNVADEIELLVSKYKVEHINFLDDNFSADTQRVIEICKEIVGRRLGITWNAMTRVDSVNEELAYRMRISGCVWTAFGIETGDASVMKKISKEITNERAIRAFEIFKKEGIATVALLMVGNPGETDSSIEETKKLMRQIKPYLIVASKTEVLPATELYRDAKIAGFIDDDFWLTDAPPPIYTAEHDETKLDMWVNEISNVNIPFPRNIKNSLIFKNKAVKAILNRLRKRNIAMLYPDRYN